MGHTFTNVHIINLRFEPSLDNKWAWIFAVELKGLFHFVFRCKMIALCRNKTEENTEDGRKVAHREWRVCCLGFLLTWYKLVSSRKRDPQLRSYQHIRLTCMQRLWNTFLINDWSGRVKPTVGGTTHRKQVEQVVETEAVSNIPPWPLLQFLPWVDCKL
jgi:hypothetical protein